MTVDADQVEALRAENLRPFANVIDATSQDQKPTEQFHTTSLGEARETPEEFDRQDDSIRLQQRVALLESQLRQVIASHDLTSQGWDLIRKGQQAALDAILSGLPDHAPDS